MMMFAPVSPPDAAAAAAARARQDTLTKPRGALGRLEDLSVWVASCQGHCPPKQFERARVVVFAGDHGVARSGVSAYPPEVTAQMVANIDAGGAAINALADIAGATVRVVDLAVDADALSAQIGAHKVRRSSGDIAVEDALTDEETVARDRRRPPDRRPGGRCRRRSADRRRHGHRKHHRGSGSGGRADGRRAGRGGRLRNRDRRRRVGPQNRGGARCVVPGAARVARPGRDCCGVAAAPIWRRWRASARRPRCGARRCCWTAWR